MAHWRSKELTIYLSDSCNMKCAYCYPGDYVAKTKRIDPEFVFSGIDYFLVEHRETYNLDKIRFYSLGEPTLEIEKLKEFHSYIRQVRPDITQFELQTNGAFSETVANWIGENISMVWISLDGPEDIQNGHRRFHNGDGTFDKVAENVQRLVGSKAKVGIRPTVTKDSVDRMQEILVLADSLGVQAVYFHPVIKQQGKNAQSTGTIYDIPLMHFARKYIEDVHSQKHKYPFFIGNYLTMNFDEKSSFYCRACMPCPQLTVDGYISCCDKGPLGADPKFSQMIFGKWHQGEKRIELDHSKISLLKTRKVENMKPCRTCSMAQNCGGGCLGEANFLLGDIFGVVPEYCEAVKYLGEHVPRNNGGLFAYTHP